MTKEIIIKPYFEFKTVFSAMKSIWISKASNKILLIILLFFTLSLISSLFIFSGAELIELVNSIKNNPISLLFFAIPFLSYLSIYLNAKNQLNNYRLKENIEFIFNKDYFKEKGETFDINHFWDKLYKIKEHKDYFLIYQTKVRANIIPKKNITSDQYNELKELFNSIDIKKSLK